MKKFILISSLFFLPLLAFSQDKQAEVKFDVTTIDYGEVEFESDGKRIFKFKNIGTAPLYGQEFHLHVEYFPKKPKSQ
jgi:hypothetical protein